MNVNKSTVSVHRSPASPADRHDSLLVVGPASSLAKPRDFLTHADSGTPLLVIRQEDGSVRGFLNVCRHRGVRVVDEPCGNQRTFSCPYHGWTYGADGALKGIPFRQGFDEINRDERGLVGVSAIELGGLIWAMPTREGGPNVEHASGPIQDLMHDVALGELDAHQDRLFVSSTPDEVETILSAVFGRRNSHTRSLTSDTLLVWVDGGYLVCSTFLRPGLTSSAVNWWWFGADGDTELAQMRSDLTSAFADVILETRGV